MAAEALDGEALRRAVIAAAHDPRVRSMLATAEVSVEPAGAPWEASHGPVQGYAVAVALCAEDLAAVDASPATRDQLERGFAVAVGEGAAHAMTSLATRWNGRGMVQVTNYREAARRSEALPVDVALARYLALTEGTDAPRLSVVERGGVFVVGAPATLDRAGRTRVERALASMRGATAKVEWVSG